MAELDVIYVRDGWQICMVEYGTNIHLVKDLIAKGFATTQVLPPDEGNDISYTLVWTRKLPNESETAPTVVIP